MVERKIFKTLISVEEALDKFEEHYKIKSVGVEVLPLLELSGRTLSQNIVSNIDVPNFDRAMMDGYAIIASDIFKANEIRPIQLKIVGMSQPGTNKPGKVNHGEAVEIGTGAPIPQGANAVVMVEYTKEIENKLNVYKFVLPGENIIPAGSDKMVGELVLRRGQKISPREIGVLSALGFDKIEVYRKPKVAIISTGNELVEPGKKLSYAHIFDINSNSIAASVLENGGAPLKPVIVNDDKKSIKNILISSLLKADIILTSGSTSAGSSDIIHEVIDDLGSPGVIVHGLSIKPGKPTLVAVINEKPIIGLPGYPTSALMIFNLLVAPIIRKMAGLPKIRDTPYVVGKVAEKIFSERGRRELLPVHLISIKNKFLIYSVGYGSGAISTISLADGYVDIPKNQEFLDEGDELKVRLFSSEIQQTDLVIIGSHCTGIDLLLQQILKLEPDITFKIINKGSLGGVQSVEIGEADIAGIHILDENSGNYNIPYIGSLKSSKKVCLIRGYSREQGLIVAKNNPKRIMGLKDLLRNDIVFLNRNPGSGTRILIDLKLNELAKSKKMYFNDLKKKITGYDTESKSHQAIAASIAFNKADVGIGIKTVAHFYDLEFIPIINEMFDFLIPSDRLNKKSVKLFLDTLKSIEFRNNLSQNMPGLNTSSDTGEILFGKK